MGCDLETACTAQMRALFVRRDNVLIAAQDAQIEVRSQIEKATLSIGSGIAQVDLFWQEALRKVGRAFPGFNQ